MLLPRYSRFLNTTKTYFTDLEQLSFKRQMRFKTLFTTTTTTNNSLSATSTNKKLLESATKSIDTKMVNTKVSKITLYKVDQSPPARAVMMIIKLLGLDVNLEDLNPLSREQDEPPYVKMNPMRTIPILDEGDFSLGDSHAIMIYLIDTYGKPEHDYLYPKNPRKRAIVNHVLFFECGILFPRLRAIMAPTYKGRLTELSKYMKINIDDAYKMIEVFLSERKFLADDVITIADFSVFTTLQSLHTMHPVNEEKYPKLKKWLKTMSRLDVVKRVDKPGDATHGETLLKIMEINKENQQRLAKL